VRQVPKRVRSAHEITMPCLRKVAKESMMPRKALSALTFLALVALLIVSRAPSNASDNIYAGAQVRSNGSTPTFQLSMYTTGAYGSLFTYWLSFQMPNATYSGIVLYTSVNPVTNTQSVYGYCADINDYFHYYYFRLDLGSNASQVGLKITSDTSSWNSATAMSGTDWGYMYTW